MYCFKFAIYMIKITFCNTGINSDRIITYVLFTLFREKQCASQNNVKQILLFY